MTEELSVEVAGLESRSARRRRARREKAQALREINASSPGQATSSQTKPLSAVDLEIADEAALSSPAPSRPARGARTEATLPRRRRRPRDLSMVFMGPY